MWRNRYDDLWLWPMPEWFVRACNRTIGAYVLDLMLVGGFVGLGFVVAGNFCGDAGWMGVVGYVLLAPVPLLMVMMIITAQYRRWKYRNGPPDGGTDAGEPNAALDRPRVERSGKVRVGRRGAGH